MCQEVDNLFVWYLWCTRWWFHCRNWTVWVWWWLWCWHRHLLIFWYWSTTCIRSEETNEVSSW